MTLWDILQTDLESIFAADPSPVEDITYTPAGQSGIECKAIVEPATDEYASVNDDEHNVLRRIVTVRIADVAAPKRADTVTLADLGIFAVESVEMLSSVFARLVCEKQQRTRAGTPGSRLEAP